MNRFKVHVKYKGGQIVDKKKQNSITVYKNTADVHSPVDKKDFTAVPHWGHFSPSFSGWCEKHFKVLDSVIHFFV